MITSYKIELKPNREQVKWFRLNSGVSRYAYNWALEKHTLSYELFKTSGATKPKASAFAWMKEFTPIKNQSEWMNKCSKWTPQTSLINLQKAFERFFKCLGAYPKRKNGSSDSFTVRATRVGYNYIILPKIGKVRLKRKGYATNIEIEVSGITISRQADRWFCSFYIKSQTKIPTNLPRLVNLSETEIVGLDLGIRDLGISSDGQVFQNPKSYKKYQKKLKKYQRVLARQINGSRNRNKTKTKIQKLHRKIANIRKDCSNKMTSSLTKSGSKMLIMETLKPKNMSKNHKLAGAILDASFGEIHRQISYKCVLRGVHLVKAHQFFASSKFCSVCGMKNKYLTLDIREWVCSSCGANQDRDFNASKNLQYFGRWLLEPVTKLEKNTEGYSEINACGDERLQFLREQCSSMKQEFLKAKYLYLTI
jgi:putative transposase